MIEFENYLNYKPTKKDRLDFVCGILAESEQLIADASGRHKEFEEYKKHLGDLWLQRHSYKNQYDSIIGLCDSWLKKISAEAETIGCSYLVLFPEIPAIKGVYVDPLEELKCYIDAVKRTTARLRPVLDQLQEQELLPKKDLVTPKTIVSQPQFKNNCLYIGEHKIRFKKGTLNWCMIKAVFDNKTSEYGANATDIFELENPSDAQIREANDREKHKYLATRKRINDRITAETGIKDEFILVDMANYSINKDFGL